MTLYKNSVQIFDNFFNNPNSVIELGNSLEFYNNEAWPGKRTNNLLEINNHDCLEFAKFFAKSIADNVFHVLILCSYLLFVGILLTIPLVVFI